MHRKETDSMFIKMLKISSLDDKIPGIFYYFLKNFLLFLFINSIYYLYNKNLF